jgi:hypothetical protein
MWKTLDTVKSIRVARLLGEALLMHFNTELQSHNLCVKDLRDLAGAQVSAEEVGRSSVTVARPLMTPRGGLYRM